MRRSGPTEEEAQRTQEDRGDGQLSLAHRALANLGRSVGGGEGKFGARLYEPACDAVSPPRSSTRSAPNPPDGPARLAILRIAKRKTASTSAIDFIRRSDCVQKGYLSEQ